MAQFPEQPAVLFKDKIHSKLPGGDGFKAHQNVQAGWEAYARYQVSILVSMDTADAAKGCLETAAGWHDMVPIGADKRAAFPPDIDRQDGKTYRFRV